MKGHTKQRAISAAVALAFVVTALSGAQPKVNLGNAVNTSESVNDVSPIVFRYDYQVGQEITNQKQTEEQIKEAERIAQEAARREAEQKAAQEAKAKKDARTARTKSTVQKNNKSSSGTLSVSSSSNIGSTVVSAARSYIGTPYGASRNGVSIDCSGLVYAAYKQAGISLPHAANLQGQVCYSSGHEISAGQLQPGDLIFWNYAWGRGFRNIGHVGIYAGNGRVIHASPNGVVECSIFDRGSIAMYGRPY